MAAPINEETFIKDLGSGLILRHATPKDAEGLSAFNAMIHSDDGPDKPDARIAAWTRDLLSRPHPSFRPGDFTIVAEAASGRIVSSVNLISQTWRYGGLVDFGVGRPELVGTLPEYRKRGLVRAQFEEIHRWSAERGETVQAITGIPYYYRQFGYEMAMELDGARFCPEASVPALPEGASEQFTLRPAEETDIPLLAQIYEHACERSLVVCPRSKAQWQYELSGRSAENVNRVIYHIIQGLDGQAAGYLGHVAQPWRTGVTVFDYELLPGISWLAVTPFIQRTMWRVSQEALAAEGRHATSFGWWLGSEHPAYEVLGENLLARRTYAWYIRIPDLPGFLRQIAPALEKRLAESIACGHSGELKINLYRSMLKLVFERGRLTGVESLKADARDWGDAAFPGLTLYQVIFGYRSFTDLRAAYPDCFWENEQGRVLISILFPKHYARLLAVA